MSKTLGDLNEILFKELERLDNCKDDELIDEIDNRNNWNYNDKNLRKR